MAARVPSEDNKRVAKNTLALYVRMLFVMAVSLYTSRIVLDYLGEEDFGINNVVGGIVTMFSFLSGTLASASQRYFAFEIGRGDMKRLRETFSLTLKLYAVVVACIFVLSEAVGIWFVNTKMAITPDRLYAANWVFQTSVVTFCVGILATPYQAIIIAREKMNVYAYVGMLEAFLQLASILFLKFFVTDADGLIAYGIAMLIYRSLCQCFYVVYSRIRFPETHLMPYWDTALVKEMFSYSFWNVFGALANVVRSQGINMLLSVFFSAVVNAARGIAYQVSSAILIFSNNFYTAVRPQITKYYAKGNTRATQDLVFRSSKMTFFLLSFVAIPVYVFMEPLMHIWLVEVPELTVPFAKLVLLTALIDSLSLPIMTLMQATGKVKVYQLVTGGLILLNLPISWVLLRMGFPAICTLYVALCIAVLAFFSRLWVARVYAQLSVRGYFSKVVSRIVAVSVLSYASSFAVSVCFPESLNFWLASVAVSMSVLCSLTAIFVVGLSAGEKESIIYFVKSHFSRIIKR